MSTPVPADNQSLSPEVAALVASIPVWAGAREIHVAPLQDVISLNNANYRVSADGAEYVLRVAAPTAALLGVRRNDEHNAARAAARAGVAPEILYFDTDGNMVTPFIRGKHWQPADFFTETNQCRLAETVRRLHEVRDVRAGVSVFERVERLLESAQTMNVEMPPHLEKHRYRMREWDQLRREDTRFGPGLCHNDLWANNFLDDGENLSLLDWEFAGVGDGLYDLATLCMAGKYSPEQQGQFLHLYGYTEPGDLQTLQTMKEMVRYFEASWGLVQHGLRGSSGFDYLGYSQRTFAAMENPDG